MGLDQYARAFTPRADEVIADVDVTAQGEREKFHQWRKHPNLHGWMEALYRAKGGTDPDFNCNTVRLTAEDIDALERDVRAGALPYTSGFFFGTSSLSDYDDDLAFIAKARERLARGEVVLYDSWW